jgi:hypothetical protein
LLSLELIHHQKNPSRILALSDVLPVHFSFLTSHSSSKKEKRMRDYSKEIEDVEFHTHKISNDIHRPLPSAGQTINKQRISNPENQSQNPCPSQAPRLVSLDMQEVIG